MTWLELKAQASHWILLLLLIFFLNFELISLINQLKISRINSKTQNQTLKKIYFEFDFRQ
jgi:hypothetical protein